VAQDLFKYFRIEARELSEELGKAVLELEKEPSAPPLVARLLRLAHTLKGAARVVKHREIAARAHSIEAGLATFRDASTPITRTQIEQLLRDVDEIDRATRALGDAPAPESPSVAPHQSPRPCCAPTSRRWTRCSMG
jgi:two-component system chemotaxis sensor kinase CheA